MRLLFVGTSPFLRGTETHLVSLARAMAQAGHAVLTVAHPEGHVARELRSGGLEVEPGIFRNAVDPRGARAVLRSVRRLRPEWLVGSFGHEYWPLALLGRWTGTRVALFRHINSRLKPSTRLLAARGVDRFIAVSESMRAHLVGQGLPAERVQLLYNPLDLGHFRPEPRLREETRAALGLTEEHVLVGFVGSLDQAKGAFSLAEAFNQAMPAAPHLRALWVGQEKTHARLREALSPALHARHTLRGWTADVRPLYAAMDVLAMPSEVLESFGRVSIEAQACGVPVLGSRWGGIPETLQEGTTGWLLPPRDVEAWREGLLTVARLPPGTRKEMGLAGARFVAERFDLPHIAARFTALLQSDTPYSAPYLPLR
jgi:glycosyltransferase involved in cell wall biosynthesis